MMPFVFPVMLCVCRVCRIYLLSKWFRNLLEQAVSEELVSCDEDPQTFTSGDLVGLANLLANYLDLDVSKVAADRDRAR
jgi:hypothetical protein